MRRRCRCGELLVVTKDVIGRERLRCPTCQGVVAPRVPRRRDESAADESSHVSPFLLPCLEP